MAISTVSSAFLLALAAVPLSTADTGAQIFNVNKRQATCAASVESCSAAASAATTCCVNRPGGQFLQVQFWDTDPVEGELPFPKKKWKSLMKVTVPH